MPNNFNLLRLLFCLAVVISHSAPLLGVPSPLIEKYLGDFIGLSFGGYAVHGFFAISGYLITNSYLRNPNLTMFFVNRTFRIAPALCIAIPFGMMLSSLSYKYVGNTWTTLNGSLWTLSWEVGCYIACGVLGAIGILNKRAFPAFFSSACLLYIVHMGSPTETFTVGISMLMLFLVGGYVATMDGNIPLGKCALLAIVIHLAIVYEPTRSLFLQGWAKAEIAYGPNFSDRQILTFLHLATFPFIVLWIGMGLPKILELKTDISYGVYIYAWPLQQAIVYWMRESGHALTHPIQLIVLVLPPLLLVSYLSWKLVESPILSMKRMIVFKGKRYTSPKNESSVPDHSMGLAR